MKHVLVALLRGINVGRAKRIAMADLRDLVESLGYREVRTLLNSGNVVFASASGEPRTAGLRIEKALSGRLGVSARVTILARAELAEVVADNPFGKIATNPSRYLVAFFPDPAAARKLVPLLKERWEPEAIEIGRRVAYVWCPESILESPLFEGIGRIAKDGVTTRNWATVTKLHALALGEPAA
jgi:uncharacterized protein (DUF1697 family)